MLTIKYSFDKNIIKINNGGMDFDPGHFIDADTVPGISVGQTGTWHPNLDVDMTQARNIITDHMKRGLVGHEIQTQMVINDNLVNETIDSESKKFTESRSTISAVTNKFDMHEHVIWLVYRGSDAQFLKVRELIQGIEGISAIKDTSTDTIKELSFDILSMNSAEQLAEDINGVIADAVRITGGTMEPDAKVATLQRSSRISGTVIKIVTDRLLSDNEVVSLTLLPWVNITYGTTTLINVHDETDEVVKLAFEGRLAS